jgi:hypothetical protein
MVSSGAELRLTPYAKQQVGRQLFFFTKTRAFALIFDFFNGHHRVAKRARARGEPYER